MPSGTDTNHLSNGKVVVLAPFGCVCACTFLWGGVSANDSDWARRGWAGRVSGFDMQTILVRAKNSLVINSFVQTCRLLLLLFACTDHFMPKIN